MDYLKRMAGRRTIPVEIGSHYLSSEWGQKLITLSEFIDRFVLVETDPNDSKTSHAAMPITTARGYLAQHPLFDQVPKLKNDIITPDYCYLGESEDITINAWFGPAGTVSPLHFDPDHNLLCQVIGAKYIRLYAEHSTQALYPHESTMLRNSSRVDCENPDKDLFPLFAQAPYWDCILRAGEVLYIPPRVWHYVRSLSVSFSVSFWFK